MNGELCCMVCGSPRHDAYEVDGPFSGGGVTIGEIWTYCKACDCWAAHPPDDNGSLPPPPATGTIDCGGGE